MLHLNTAGA
jgi:hypothetical protein